MVSKGDETCIFSFYPFPGMPKLFDSFGKFHCDEQHVLDLDDIGWSYVESLHEVSEMMHYIDAQVSLILQVSIE